MNMEENKQLDVDSTHIDKEVFDRYERFKLLNISQAVSKFKSINRAIRRGHLSPVYTIYPSRPFNNRKPTRGRQFNERKKFIYAELRKLGKI